MSLNLLFDNFDKIVNAPGGVAKMRETILQMAMQGKLVPQDPGDEPAEELLKTMQDEKAKLLAEGKIKKWKSLPEIRDDEVPYALPNGWAYIRLGNLIKISSGDALTSKDMVINGGIPVYGGNGITGYHDNYNIEKPTLVMGRVGYYCGSVHITGEKAWITDNAFKVWFAENCINQEYLYWLLKGTNLKERENATAQPVISATKIYPLVVAIAPLREQQRIVTKIEELFALCDQIEIDQKLQAEKQQHWVESAVSRMMSAQGSQEFAEHWGHIAQNFDSLISTPNAVKELRQGVLQLAVQGKLVPQDANDEPALELLKRVAAEKEWLITEGKIKKEKQLHEITDEEVPYELPTGWEWVRLYDVTENIHYGYSAASTKVDTGVKLLRITDIQKNTVLWDKVPYCLIDSDKVNTYCLNNNDLLIARTGGTIGKSYIVTDVSSKSVFASYLIRLIPLKNVFAQYIKRFLESPMYWEQLYAQSQGTGQPNVNATSLKQIVMPLPAQAEQHRIVAKVDELMDICDKLEHFISQVQAKRQHFMEAVLHKIAN
jgi:type I restriction enzyme S subunit